MNRERVTAKRRLRLREAISWFTSNKSDKHAHRPSAESDWGAWCADADNRDAYTKVMRLHQEIAALPRPTLPSREALLEDVGCAGRVPVSPQGDGNSQDHSHSHQRRPRFFRRLALLAAAIALLSVVITLIRSGGSSTRVGQSYTTAPGEQLALTLPDGSKIRLGGDTVLVTRFTTQTRTIELQRGEAFFSVQHNPQQPFIVTAAGATTTAIGTAFEVRRYGTRVQVWVREGTVEVAPLKEAAAEPTLSNGESQWRSVRVARGEQMTYTARGEASLPQQADPHVTAAWSEGHLVPLIYRGRTLQEVIDEVQPYSRRRIMVDPAAADLEYTGIVNPEDVYAWIRDLPSIYPNVDVIDCRTSTQHPPVCLHTDRIVIRVRLNSRLDIPESVLLR